MLIKPEPALPIFRIIAYNRIFTQLTKLPMDYFMKSPEGSLFILLTLLALPRVIIRYVLQTICKKTRLVTTVMMAACLSTSPLFISRAVTAGDVTEVPSGLYTLDPTHAYLQFQYNHLGLSNPILAFDDFTVNMTLDNVNPVKSSIEVEIDVNSIQTGSSIWHQHLVGSDWFDTATHPTITFTSTEIYGGGAVYIVTGDLVIKGKSLPATIEVTINAATTHPFENKPVIGLGAVGSLLRSEWGLGKNAPYVSDEVEIRIEAELFKD